MIKYEDVKDKLREYFKNIDPEYLYKLAIQCGFKLIDKKDKNKYLKNGKRSKSNFCNQDH